MTQTEQGDLTQSVSLSYRDYNPESGKVDAVRLTFDYDKRENEYFLTDKSDAVSYTHLDVYKRQGLDIGKRLPQAKK